MLISKVNNLKIKYEQKPNEYFLTLDEYLLMAKKSISRFAPSLAPRLLKNEDFVSEIAYSIMMADWRWDSSKDNNKDGKNSRVGYRSKCADWAIKVNIKKLKNKNNLPSGEQILSLNHNVGNDEKSVDLYNIVEDKRISKFEPNIDINTFFDNSNLTDSQKKYLEMRYINGVKLKDIAEQSGTTIQNINKIINIAIKKIKKYHKINN